MWRSKVWGQEPMVSTQVSAVWGQMREPFWRICGDSHFTEGLPTTGGPVVVLLFRGGGGAVEGGVEETVQTQKPETVLYPFM